MPAITTATPITGIDSAGIAAMLLAATRLVRDASRRPKCRAADLRCTAAARCFCNAVFCAATLDCSAPDTVRTPSVDASSPETAVLKAALVSVSTLVASRPARVTVNSSRFRSQAFI
ncbi:MAG: hypothetical protein U5K56_21295 [Halioglobus sp.]|nr:hypothetical protein [Halioglobus sp.]